MFPHLLGTKAKGKTAKRAFLPGDKSGPEQFQGGQTPPFVFSVLGLAVTWLCGFKAEELEGTITLKVNFYS